MEKNTEKQTITKEQLTTILVGKLADVETISETLDKVYCIASECAMQLDSDCPFDMDEVSNALYWLRQIKEGYNKLKQNRHDYKN